jgi:O-acetylserine/cysteine efflux transporter
MSRRDLALATAVAVVWGLSFIVVKWGLSDIPPLLFASLRFGALAVLAPLLPRPAVPAPWLLLYGFSWGTVQFGGLFLALAFGLPAGAASIVAQSQLLFTLLFALALRLEPPSPRHVVTVGLAASGLAVIGAQHGDRLPLPGLVAILCGAAGWGGGNVLARRLAQRGFRADTIGFLAWASVVPAASLLALSLVLEGPAEILVLVSHFSLRTGLVLVYQSSLSLAGGAIAWNVLLRRYPPSTVAPFSLLVPVVGLTASHVVFGETISGPEWLGIALLLAGLTNNVLGARGREPRTSPVAATLPAGAAKHRAPV